jgi:hypothetical protein
MKHLTLRKNCSDEAFNATVLKNWSDEALYRLASSLHHLTAVNTI